MKKTIFSVLAILVYVSPSLAKVTLYSNKDAIAKVMESEQLVQLEQNHGQVSRIAVETIENKNAFQDFEVQLTFTTKAPWGNVSCYANAQVLVVKANAPAGITASVMTDAVFGNVVCEK